jgi:hypothetical protein
MSLIMIVCLQSPCDKQFPSKRIIWANYNNFANNKVHVMKAKSCHTNYMEISFTKCNIWGKKKHEEQRCLYHQKTNTLQTKSYLVTVEISNTKSKSQVTKPYPVHINSFELRQLKACNIITYNCFLLLW